MVAVALLTGRVLLLALVYLFLLAAVRAGLGLIRRGTPAAAVRTLMLSVEAGPPELRGVRLPLDVLTRIGRTAGLELVIADDFVSSTHARIVPTPDGPLLEDLASTNGPVLNGRRVVKPVPLAAGDVIEIGTVKMRVTRS